MGPGRVSHWCTNCMRISVPYCEETLRFLHSGLIFSWLLTGMPGCLMDRLGGCTTLAAGHMRNTRSTYMGYNCACI